MGSSMKRGGAFLVLTLLASSARAQDGVDAYVGPALGAGRVVGLGGAFTAVAEGSEGLFRNPAALSNRTRPGELGFRVYLSLDLSLDNLEVTPATADLDGDGQSAAIDSLSLGNTSLGVMISKFAIGFV